MEGTDDKVWTNEVVDLKELEVECGEECGKVLKTSSSSVSGTMVLREGGVGAGPISAVASVMYGFVVVATRSTSCSTTSAA